MISRRPPLRLFPRLSPASLARTWVLGLALAGTNAATAPIEHDLRHPAHDYWQRTPRDRLTALKADLESGAVTLDRTSEKAFVLGLLDLLGIPPSSQLLVFSATSLQTSLISTSNPRALYFRDDAYLGYIPRGRIEVITLDPELGGILHIFDIPRADQALRIDRSDRCMNCHGGPDTGYVPGLLAQSVIPGPNRGSLVSFRDGVSGHGVPLQDRLGGWYLTGRHALTNHWGNRTGRLFQGELTTTLLDPGAEVDLSRYPAATSDILAHLLHEHQVGFVNRFVEAAYRARLYLHRGNGTLSTEDAADLDRVALELARYTLFADEVPLPAGGLQGDPDFQAAFLRDRKRSRAGDSLRDLNLQTRLFQYRCSYMIDSPPARGLPAELQTRFRRQLDRALATDPGAPEAFAYLPVEERTAIRRILRETLPEFGDPR